MTVSARSRSEIITSRPKYQNSIRHHRFLTRQGGQHVCLYQSDHPRTYVLRPQLPANYITKPPSCVVIQSLQNLPDIPAVLALPPLWLPRHPSIQTQVLRASRLWVQLLTAGQLPVRLPPPAARFALEKVDLAHLVPFFGWLLLGRKEQSLCLILDDHVRECMVWLRP